MNLPGPALWLAFRHAIVHTRWRGSYATCIMDEDDGYHLWMGPTVNNRLNPSCHLLKSMGFCLTLTVKSPISPQEEPAHGRHNDRDGLSV